MKLDAGLACSYSVMDSWDMGHLFLLSSAVTNSLCYIYSQIHPAAIMLSLEGQKRAIMSYITMKEGEGEYHKCTKCPRMYNSEDLLESHMQRKHSIEEVTSIPREASNFGGVIQSTLQRRRDKTRQQSSVARGPTFSPVGGSAGSGGGMPTLHEGTTVKVGGRCVLVVDWLC